MAKYVQFNFANVEPIYYDVDDFNIDIIRTLPSYNDKWQTMKFIEGEKRASNGKIRDVYSTKTLKIIYWGKKISYEDTRKIIGSDLKYKYLMWDMDVAVKNSFALEYNHFVSDEDYKQKLKKYQEQYDKSHYCLFTLPDKFSAFILESRNSITIEEFDSEIILDYDKDLKNIENNAIAGEKYILEHKFILELFKKYFDMLCRSCLSYPVNIWKIIFSSVPFVFDNFENLSTLEDINFFLDICDYVYGFSNYGNELFKKYKHYVNDCYNNLEYGEEPKI